MKPINLNYLKLPKDHHLVEILKSYGEQITSGTQNNITYIVTDTRKDNQIESLAFYLIIPELNKQLRYLSIDIVSATEIEIRQWNKDSTLFELHKANFNESYFKEFDDLVGDILNNSLTKMILNFFIESIELKRDINKSWKMS